MLIGPILLSLALQASTYVLNDPPANPKSGYNDSALFLCTNTTFPGWHGGTGWTSAQNECLHAILYQQAPGESLGNPNVGPGGWAVHSALSLTGQINSPGISELLSGYQVKAGVGDNTGFYFYNWNYGGATAPSDEGNHPGAVQGGEMPVTYAGTITTGGAGATAVVINCTADCKNPGDGRYLIRTQAPIATGNITAITSPSGNFTPGTITISSNVPVSPFWGTLNADLVTPAATPLGTGSTAMTFAVTQGGGAGAPTPGDLICFGGQFHEQARITAVAGAGPYTITAKLRHAHEAQSWVVDGGACGTFVEVVANNATPRSQLLRFPVDVIGSTSANTLLYRYFAFGRGNEAFHTAALMVGALNSVKGLVNVGGTVTFEISGGYTAALLNAPSIYFSGASDAAFNGQCTNVHLTSFFRLACTQSSSTSHTKPATASVSFGTTQYGNSAFNLWSGAEVLDVQDYATTPPSIDGHLTLEPNSVTWNAGDAVEQPHHYAAHMDLMYNNSYIYNPTGIANGGMDWGVYGAGWSGGLFYSPTSMAASHVRNGNPASLYQYHGGTLTPPLAFSWMGLWNSYLTAQYAPDPIGSPAMFIGCPYSGCDDPAYSYDLFKAATNQNYQQSIIGFRPFQGSLSFNTRALHFANALDGFTMNDSLTFAPMASPLNLGSHATAGGQLADATTYFYFVVATNSAGSSLRSPEFSVTTASNGGKNGVRVQWSRAAGATGYTVCRGASSGSEQQLQQNPGGNNGDTTFFDDYGTATSGACPGTTNTSRGGINYASSVGINSPGTNYETVVSAPGGQSSNQTLYLPNSPNATLAVAPLSGTTASVGGAALTAGQCASSKPLIVAGASLGMVAVVSPANDPGDGFTWQARVSGPNRVTVKVCAIIAGTPAASTYNVRVIP